MIALLWARLQSWGALLIGALLLLVGAYAAGYRKATHSAELKQKADALDYARKARGARDEVEREVRNLPTGGAADELRQHWSRD
jgi:hypothetical protein